MHSAEHVWAGFPRTSRLAPGEERGYLFAKQKQQLFGAVRKWKVYWRNRRFLKLYWPSPWKQVQYFNPAGVVLSVTKPFCLSFAFFFHYLLFSFSFVNSGLKDSSRGHVAFCMCRFSTPQLWLVLCAWGFLAFSLFIVMLLHWIFILWLANFWTDRCACCEGFGTQQSVSRTCLVAYLVRSIDCRCTQPDWDAANQQLSLLFFLLLLSDERWVETNQELHQIVELISRKRVYYRAGEALHCRSCLFAWEASKVLLKQRLIRRQASRHCERDIVKVQSTWTQRGLTDPHAVTVFFFVALLYLRCYSEPTKVVSLSMQLPKAAMRLQSFRKTQLYIAGQSSAFYFWISQCMLPVWV